MNIVNYLAKKEADVDSLKKDKKEFLKNSLSLKPQQKIKSNKHILLKKSKLLH